jgi:hypothetical protein
LGAKYLGSYVGMARPILVERDYRAVKRVLADRCHGIYLLLEAERIEALIRELTLYEDRPDDEAEILVLTTTPVDAPPSALNRRWSDPH